MTYTFWINHNSVVTQVYPLNWLECTLQDSKEKGQVFYRRKFQGSLTFGGKKLCCDFELFYDIEVITPCERLYLLIMRDTDIYWEGYFSTSMGAWDMDAQTFTVTPLLLDDYLPFDEDGDVVYSVLTQTAQTVNLTFGTPVAIVYAFSRCRYLIDFIEYVVNQICGGTVTSAFLNNVNNYVTGDINHYNKLLIAQKSDIKRWDSSNPATVADMTWNEIVELLKIMNLAWRYNAVTNIVTIEHVSYFTSAAGLDLRTQEIALSNSKYAYTKEQTPKYEKFYWMESGNDEFLDATIWYDSLCVNQNPDTNTKEQYWNVTTDIQYICECMESTDTLQNISDEGWVLLACYESGGLLYIYQTNRPMNNIYYNCDLGWGILLNALFRHERMQLTGYVKGILTTFVSMVKNKIQETAMIWCEEYDPTLYFTTELGETYFAGAKGYVSTATLAPDGSVKLKLLYGEPDNPDTGFSFGKGMVITEVKTLSPNTTTYTAVLTEPADANLKWQIRLVISNASPAMCTTAWFDLDIALGASTGNVAVPWCTPAGGCPCRIEIHDTNDAGLLAWDWTIVYDPAVFIY